MRQRAASLADATGRPWALTDVLARVLRAVEQHLASLKAGRVRLSEACRPWCVLTGRAVTIAAGRDRIEGVCAGIDDDGALLVTAQAAPRRLFSGVVEAIAWHGATFRAAPRASASCHRETGSEARPPSAGEVDLPFSHFHGRPSMAPETAET